MESSRKEGFDQDVLRSVSERTHSLEWALRCGGVGVFLEYRNGEVHTTALTREWFSIPSDSPIATAEQFFAASIPRIWSSWSSCDRRCWTPPCTAN